MAIKHGGNFTAKEKDHLKNIQGHATDLLGVDEGEEKHGAFSLAQKGDKIQAMHDHITELGAACAPSESKAVKAVKFMVDSGMNEEAGEQYARQELWDIQTGASALATLTALSSEMDEPDDAKEVAALMRGICNFIMGEIDEMEQAATGAGKHYAQVKDKADGKLDGKLDLSYAKSIMGLVIPDADLVDKLAVKYVGRDEIRAYSNLYGNPSLTDVETEYFNNQTDFWDKNLSFPRPLTWDHAQDEDFKSDPVIGSVTEMGDDEWGKWYVAKLERGKAYRKYLDSLIERKALGTSSDSAPQYVIRQKSYNGKNWIKNGNAAWECDGSFKTALPQSPTWLKRWPVFAMALTEIPCEPRMLETVNWKSLGVDLTKFQAPDTAHELTKEELREASLLVTLYSRS